MTNCYLCEKDLGECAIVFDVTVTSRRRSERLHDEWVEYKGAEVTICPVCIRTAKAFEIYQREVTKCRI